MALTTALVLQWAHSQIAFTSNPAPGKLIDVGGHQVHLLCEGVGSPTVILEAGAPGSSLSWASIAGDIATFARVCAYDRAGYAWSEAGPEPRTIVKIASELRLLLHSAEVNPPYVLVGHSFGGLVVQLYASRFPNEVAGMVLVDSSHSDLSLRAENLEAMSALSLAMRLLAPTGLHRFLLPIPAGRPESRPSSVRIMERELLFTTRSVRALASELAGLRESLNQAACGTDRGAAASGVLARNAGRSDETVCHERLASGRECRSFHTPR